MTKMPTTRQIEMITMPDTTSPATASCLPRPPRENEVMSPAILKIRAKIVRGNASRERAAIHRPIVAAVLELWRGALYPGPRKPWPGQCPEFRGKRTGATRDPVQDQGMDPRTDPASDFLWHCVRNQEKDPARATANLSLADSPVPPSLPAALC